MPTMPVIYQFYNTRTRHKLGARRLIQETVYVMWSSRAYTTCKLIVRMKGHGQDDHPEASDITVFNSHRLVLEYHRCTYLEWSPNKPKEFNHVL